MAAQKAMELALDYAEQRRTFGKPLAEHQSIAFRLAQMSARTEAARLVERPLIEARPGAGRPALQERERRQVVAAVKAEQSQLHADLNSGCDRCG